MIEELLVFPQLLRFGRAHQLHRFYVLVHAKPTPVTISVDYSRDVGRKTKSETPRILQVHF